MVPKTARRRIPAGRLPALVEAATQVFCQCGYNRAQMADVAAAMGVSTGAVYQYVESKEALFDLVVRANAGVDPEEIQSVGLPYPAPRPGATLAFLQTVLNRPGQWPALDAARLRKRAPADVPAEVSAVLREQYQLMRQYRYGLVLLTKSALEFPGLLEVFVLGLRQRLTGQLAEYLESRHRSGYLHAQEDWQATAAMLIQTIAWANHQRPFDPGFSHFSEDLMETTVVSNLTRGLLAIPGPPVPS